MNGKGGSSVGTFLFSIPLAAIPLMAIFGIPQFAPLVASPDRNDGYERSREDDRVDEGRYSEDRSSRRRAADVLRSRGYETSLTAHAESRGAAADWDAGEEQRPGRCDDDAPRFEASTPAATESNAPAFHGDDGSMPRPVGELADRQLRDDALPQGQSSSGMTWQSAAERLEELGISSYHLEPGAELGSFLFVCSFCPEASSHVTMRFEAESAEPLNAVGDVLAQIDHWQQQQSR